MKIALLSDENNLKLKKEIKSLTGMIPAYMMPGTMKDSFFSYWLLYIMQNTEE